MEKTRRSAIPGFYGMSLADRQAIAREWAGLGADDLASLDDSGLSLAKADLTIENVIGRYSLPLALATNFRINDHDYLVPMVVEEASVVAACSFAAKLFRQGGGFTASADEPVMIGQMQLLDLADTESASELILASKSEILAHANESAGGIVARGGARA